MKRLFIMAALTLLSMPLFAQEPDRPNRIPQQQQPNAPLLPPLATRNVSGIVKDESGQTVIGALVTLKSKSDTLRGATNADGVFIFKGVKQNTFNVTVTSIGAKDFVQKYAFSDTKKNVVLDPITLKSKSNQLAAVTINGTPTIVYKTDTIEYRASDYKVRENATLDELLKKAEGFEVGTDGTVTHQGQQITKARVNGKDFAGGDVTQAVQNLPADIVEKFQVVDDYGDQAGRTGVKSGDPTKVLNITTKADKSVGNIVRTTVSQGNNSRHDYRLFAERLNANQQLGIIGNLRNTVNGVASSGIGGGAANSAGGNGGGGNGGGGNGGGNSPSGGTTTAGGPSFNYRDQWGKKIQVNGSYRYTFSNINAISNTSGQTNSTFGSTDFIRNTTGLTKNQTHNANFEFEYSPDSSNFLRVTPSFSYTGKNTNTNSEYTQNGLVNQFSKGITTTNNTTPNYGAIILYQYLFKKNHRRNVSIQFNLNRTNAQTETVNNTTIQYRDANQNVVKDSLVNRIRNSGNINKNYRASLTYVEPITQLSQLEFNAQWNYRGNEASAVTSNINPTGSNTVIDSLSNIYNFAFTEQRYSLNYRLIKPKYNLSLGVTAIPTSLTGTNVSKNISTDRNDFYMVPLFRFQYQFSRTHQLAISYTGTPTEPTFQEIQPLPDYSNPQAPVFGNQNLKPSFRHSIVTRYNNYLPNTKWNFSANISASYIQDQITTNQIQVAQPTLHNFINETHYINLSGAKSISGNYNIAKQLDNRNYNFSLNGSVSYDYENAMSNGILGHLTNWTFRERFGPRLTPSTVIEINPFVSYELNRPFNTLPKAITNSYTKSAVNLEGKFYFGANRTWTIEYDASKNYITGVNANITKNPLVLNAYLEKEFFARKNGILRVSVFDLLNQNNFIDHTVSQYGYTDTKTNALSRYVMVSFILNLQKWTGIAQRNGRNMQRRGDGSFIY